MKTITILGLKPNQGTKIESLFGDRASFKFIDVDTPPQQIQATAASSDDVLVMTKFVPHRAQNAIRDHDGLVYVNGGVSSAVLKLEEILGG